MNSQTGLSHQLTRRQERQRRKFKSAGQAQRFLSVQVPINNLFPCRRHRLKSKAYRQARERAFEIYRQVTCAYNETGAEYLRLARINLTIPI